MPFMPGSRIYGSLFCIIGKFVEIPYYAKSSPGRNALRHNGWPISLAYKKISWKKESAYKAESRNNTFYIDKYRTEYKASYEKYRY